MDGTLTQSATGARVRWMIRSDLPSAIDVDGRANRHAWSEDDFIRNLRKRNVIGMVAERDGRIVGVVVYMLFYDRTEVIRLSVDPEFADGCAARLVDKIKQRLHAGRRDRIVVEMRETDMDGLLFLRSQGFKAVCMKRRWFEDTDEDMIRMEFRILE